MALKSDALKETQEELETLIGLGIYKLESEIFKDCLRELQAQYRKPSNLRKLRRRLDQALGHHELSALVREMRDEEMH
ncbi:MAG: hypothetical protein NZO41_01125 [Candidatus Bipolaricaulota bacterium]|nr:hypothetical protein [Candidatus Bipolaricaulota bacterium]MDW8140853.1 hypothetical protein [Candidatus Bipolaricaulota bacterium]